MTWRDHFRPLIFRVLEQLGPRRRLKTKRRALRAAYPCQQRRGWAYKVWCDEVRIQLGLRPPRFRTIHRVPDSPGQRYLFPQESPR